MAAFATPITCHRCQAPGQVTLFCQNCGLFLPDETASTERVTFTRRFFGTYLLESLLFLVTLIVGWFIWFFFTAKTSQSPAKRLVSVYVVDADSGKALTAGRMWIRDVVIKLIAFGVVNSFLFGIPGLVDLLWVFFDKNRQTLHDKMATTVVVYAPNGLPEKMLTSSLEMIGPGAMMGRTAAPAPTTADVSAQLRELSRLRDEGILTTEEYEQKRSELAGRL